jgi:hypothetical protein
VSALLIDVGWVPCCQTDDALEGLHKALMQDPGGEEAAIWAPVGNPWIEQHVEDVTRRFQGILLLLQDHLSHFLFDEPADQLSKADVPWMRWSSETFDEVKFSLEHKHPADFTLDDWMLLVEWLIARYLPDHVIETEAEYLTVKAALLGKLQATMAEQKARTPLLDAVVALVPTTFRAVPPRVLKPLELSILRTSKELAATYIGRVGEATRATMRTMIIEHVQAQILGQSEGRYTALRQRLFDEFGQLNRDFRRIAVTEAGEICNQGVVAAMPIGQMLERREAYRQACDFCKSINGKRYRVVAPDDPERDGNRDVWFSKSNKGRSASPMKREGNRLVERGPEELLWCAAGVQHPHCRGSWLPVTEGRPPEVSVQFDTFARDLIAKAQLSALEAGKRAEAANRPGL